MELVQCGFISKAKSARIAIALGLVLLISGCHSALFQTAKVHQGASATLGVTRVDTGTSRGASDYSVMVKAELGKEGSVSRFGYSFGITVISPIKTQTGQTSGTEFDLGSYPNQFGAFFPEFKLQFPHRLPLDLALDFRLAAYIPERACLIVSKDLGNLASIYTSVGYQAVIRGLWVTGFKVAFNQNIALILEESVWLSKHQYPSGVKDLDPRPQSIGFALSFSPSAKSKPASPGVACSQGTY